MTPDTLPGELTGPERHTYRAAADRARKAYRKRHGAAVTMTLAERRAWNRAHADGIAAAAARAGLAAVRKAHRARVAHRDEMTRPDRIGGPAAGQWLEILERDAAHAAARLEILAAVGAAPRKPARTRKPAAAPAAVETAAPRVRKTSKLEPCTRHAGYWSSLPPARRFANAVEGGNGSSVCDGGECTLTPGTDRYTATLAAGGPVTLAALNGAPAYVECHGCGTRDPGESHTCAPRADDTMPAAPLPARFVCKACGGETPAGIGYACHTFGPLPAPSADCGGLHADAPAPVTVPAAMPRQTRAARRASRRELADALRAVGLRPAGDVWTLARAGHEPADIVRQIAEGADLAALAAHTLEEVAR